MGSMVQRGGGDTKRETVQGRGAGGVGVYTMISDRKCKRVDQPRDVTYSTGSCK